MLKHKLNKLYGDVLMTIVNPIFLAGFLLGSVVGMVDIAICTSPWMKDLLMAIAAFYN